MPTILKDRQVSVRLPNDLKDKREANTKLTGRTELYVVMEALRLYLDRRMPQIEDLKAAVLEVDQAEFARDEEVEAVFAQYTVGKPIQARAKPAARQRVK